MIIKTYLLLGSNMGNSKTQLSVAIKHIQKEIGKLMRQSSLYRTAAWGNTDQPDFLNQVIIVESKLSAEQMIKKILDIEEKMGRVRTIKNAPRIIDIDILFIEKAIINKKNLIVPHPEIANRKFVLIPLNELSPNFKHPILNKSIHHLLTICKDSLNVKKF
ncbi:2-amino-4-hydroxy-6-hydroxymethyldihydropteridine diphosphokinase [Ferruginibacter sp. SUN002]|uniref:2-amino-4-hydroxy-6- hydroxymethyldihydropteridine diphosphokinase n=1 Tax=Ferruginibacter sp. SUN002 TaxID=2937789 RepID=UPI003D36AA22